MGHIELSRSADLLVVAPATADLMAKMAQGRADDLASTALLATDKPVLDRARHECADVAASRHPAQSRDTDGRWRAMSSDPMTARWPAANSVPAAWRSPSEILVRHREAADARCTPAGRTQGA